MLKHLLSIALIISFVSASSAETIKSPLVGVWRVNSVSVQSNSQETFKPLGEHPHGYVVFTKGGHMALVFVTDNRLSPAATPTDAEAASLFRTLNAFDGTYRIEGKNKFLLHVEDAWLPSWTGADQHREFKISGRQLTVVSRAKNPNTGQDVVITVASERIE